MEFKLAHRGLLYAIGDTERLEVYRSPVCRINDELYRPVFEYIWGNNLLLNAWVFEDDDETMMFRSAEYSIYTRPGARTESTESMSFYMEALRREMTFEELWAEMIEEGLILEHPHGGYVASPHPSIVPRYTDESTPES